MVDDIESVGYLEFFVGGWQWVMQLQAFYGQSLTEQAARLHWMRLSMEERRIVVQCYQSLRDGHLEKAMRVAVLGQVQEVVDDASGRPGQAAGAVEPTVDGG